MIIKKRKNQAKLNAIAEDFSFKKFVYIESSPALCQPFFPNKPHTQMFLTLQPKWAPKEELSLNNSNLAFRGRNSTKFWIIWIIVIQMSSLFIHITNFKITITNLNSKLFECKGHNSFIICQIAYQNNNHNILQTCNSEISHVEERSQIIAEFELH